MTPQFDSLVNFFIMDGHGVYVWAAYVLTFMILVGLIVIPSMGKRRLMVQLKRQQRIEQSRSDQP